MSNLTLASTNPTLPYIPTTQWAHDIRNALAVMSLHLETLERSPAPAAARRRARRKP